MPKEGLRAGLEGREGVAVMNEMLINNTAHSNKKKKKEKRKNLTN